MSPVDQSLKDKIKQIVPAIVERGECYLFALVQRQDLAAGTWDIVLSARWTDNNVKGGIELVSSLIKGKLTDEELHRLSRIAILPSTDRFVDDMTRAMTVTDSDVVLSHNTFNGLKLRSAILFESHRPT